MLYHLSHKNNLIIAAAGSGKSTMLIKTALNQEEGNVLILTYTNANEEELKLKLNNEKRGGITNSVVIQTWFSFLLQHGVKPFQGSFNKSLFDKKINGMMFCEGKSGLRFVTKDGQPIYWGTADFDKYYFNSKNQIYSDKISNFVIEANDFTRNSIINRLERIYTHVFIDEVQDLAGYDLEIIKLLFKSKIKVVLTGDPRQVTYLTHFGSKYSKYSSGKIKEFILNECKSLNVIIDELALAYSHRNNKQICEFSSALYPKMTPSKPCICTPCRSSKETHEGVWIIHINDVENYVKQFLPVILRSEKSIFPEWNFGKAKGKTFDRVLIFPTEAIKTYLLTGILEKKVGDKVKNTFDVAKFYVAVTRAKYSVGIVYDKKDNLKFISGLKVFNTDDV